MQLFCLVTGASENDKAFSLSPTVTQLTLFDPGPIVVIDLFFKHLLTDRLLFTWLDRMNWKAGFQDNDDIDNCCDHDNYI